MKKLFIFPILLILFLLFIAWHNNNPRVIISKLIKDGNIKTGGLRYRIDLLEIIPIGEAFFSTPQTVQYQQDKVYHLSAQAETLKIFSKLFSASVVLDSYIDIQRLIPLLFKQRLLIAGRKDASKEINYDQKNGIMSVAGVKRQIFPDTQDPLSAILNIRKMDFDKIREFEMNINSNQKNYILKGKARPSNITVNKKIYKVYVLETDIKRRDENLYHKSRITVVLLKGEEENTPILIKIFNGGLLFNARLIEIE